MRTRRGLCAILLVLAAALSACGGDAATTGTTGATAATGTTVSTAPSEPAPSDFAWGVLETPGGIEPGEADLAAFARVVFASDFGLGDAALLDPSTASMEYRTAAAEALSAESPGTTYSLARLRLSDGTVIELTRFVNTRGPEEFWGTTYEWKHVARSEAWADAAGVVFNPKPASSSADLVQDAERKEALLALAEEAVAAVGFDASWVRGEFVSKAWNQLDGPPEAGSIGGATYRASMVGLSFDADRPGYRGYLANAYSDLSTRPEGTVDLIASYDADWGIVSVRLNGPAE